MNGKCKSQMHNENHGLKRRNYTSLPKKYRQKRIISKGDATRADDFAAVNSC